MLKLIFSCSLLIISLTCPAQGISFFDGAWKEALEVAKKDDKIIFVDAYAKWCGPCKRMARDVFTQGKVGDFFNANFINLKIDMEEKDGRSFGQNYPVSAYPTLFFLDADGNILKKVTGGQQADPLIELAKLAIKSYDKSDQYAVKYEEGDRDIELMISYVKELNKVVKPSQKISNDYINSDPDISESDKARFLMAAVTASDSKLFDQLVGLKKQAISITSKEAFKATIESAALKTVDKAVEFEYEELLDEAISQYAKADLGDDQIFEYVAGMRFYSESGDYNAWKDLSKKLLKKRGKKQPDLYQEHLTTLANKFSYVAESKSYRHELAEALIKNDDSLDNYLNYVKMLIRDKENEKALKWTKAAEKKYKKDEAGLKRIRQALDYLTKMGVG